MRILPDPLRNPSSFMLSSFSNFETPSALHLFIFPHTLNAAVQNAAVQQEKDFRQSSRIGIDHVSSPPKRAKSRNSRGTWTYFMDRSGVVKTFQNRFSELQWLMFALDRSWATSANIWGGTCRNLLLIVLSRHKERSEITARAEIRGGKHCPGSILEMCCISWFDLALHGFRCQKQKGGGAVSIASWFCSCFTGHACAQQNQFTACWDKM